MKYSSHNFPLLFNSKEQLFDNYSDTEYLLKIRTHLANNLTTESGQFKFRTPAGKFTSFLFFLLVNLTFFFFFFVRKIILKTFSKHLHIQIIDLEEFCCQIKDEESNAS